MNKWIGSWLQGEHKNTHTIDIHILFTSAKRSV